MPKKIRNFYMNLKINYKISLIYFIVLIFFILLYLYFLFYCTYIFYFIVLIFFILFSCLIYYKFVAEGSTQRVKEYSKQVLAVQESSLKDKINNMNSISRMIMANTSIQNFLRDARKEYTVQSKEVFEQILNYLNIYPVARSITIYDQYYNKYGSSRNKESKVGSSIFKQPWFYLKSIRCYPMKNCILRGCFYIKKLGH